MGVPEKPFRWSMRARRFLIAAGAFALVVICLMLVGLRKDAELSLQVTASFMGYNVLDGGTEKLAVIRLTNSSSRSFWYFTNGEIASNGAPVVTCWYRAETNGGWSEWNEPAPLPKSPTLFSLSPGSSDLVAVRMSHKVENSQIGVLCLEKRTDWPEPLRNLRRLWWKVVPPKASSIRAWCDLSPSPAATKTSSQ